MRIFLIGFMGCGKSKKGRKLASHLGFQFIDMDEWIENTEGQGISEIFKLKGEDYFRKVEYAALQNILALDNCVIATGGGSPCHFDAIDVMNNHGTSIYLKATPAFLRERLLQSKKKRPLIESLTAEELLTYIENKLNEREPFYQKAKFTMDALGCRAQELALLLEA